MCPRASGMSRHTSYIRLSQYGVRTAVSPSYPTSNNKPMLGFQAAATLDSGLRDSFVARTHKHSGHPTGRVRAKPAQPMRSTPPSGLDGGSVGSVPGPPSPSRLVLGLVLGRGPSVRLALPCLALLGRPALARVSGERRSRPACPAPAVERAGRVLLAVRAGTFYLCCLEEVGGGDIGGGPGCLGHLSWTIN